MNSQLHHDLARAIAQERIRVATERSHGERDRDGQRRRVLESLIALPGRSPSHRRWA